MFEVFEVLGSPLTSPLGVFKEIVLLSCFFLCLLQGNLAVGSALLANMRWKEVAVTSDFTFSIFLCDLQFYWPYRTTFFIFEFHLWAN